MILTTMNIYDYTDYRKFLYDYYMEQKSRHRYFTVRYIAKKVGFRSASFFSQLVNDKSNISLELARKFSSFMGLTKNQSDYFEALICYNQARLHSEKRMFFEKLTTFKNSRIKCIDAKYFEFYDKWYYSAIRELLYFYEFKDDYKKLARLLIPSITVLEAQRAIARLEKWGLIKKDCRGYFSRSDKENITTGSDAQSFHINNYQQAILKLAADALDMIPRNHRQFSTLTMSLSPQGFQMFKDELQQFRRRLLDIAQKDSSENRVYQLNFQLFPLTKQVTKDENNED